MYKREDIRQQLLSICRALAFDKLPPSSIDAYEHFPYNVDVDNMTDDFVLGVQEFTTLLVHVYRERGTPQLSELPVIYASGILYLWWKTHVCDNVFEETEIDVDVEQESTIGTDNEG